MSGANLLADLGSHSAESKAAKRLRDGIPHGHDDNTKSQLLVRHPAVLAQTADELADRIASFSSFISSSPPPDLPGRHMDHRRSGPGRRFPE